MPGVACNRQRRRVKVRDMTAPGRDDPDRRLFADQLKAMRAQAGLSRDELGARIGYSGSTIASIEAMHRSPTDDQARRLDQTFGLPGIFEREAARLRKVSFPVAFRPFTVHEEEATELYVFEHSLVPGLLQSEDYAHAILATHPNTTDEEVSDRVAARLARQTVLERQEPSAPMLWTLLDEGVLPRCVGAPAVMHAQLMRLVELSRRPNVSVQVIPGMGAHPGLLGAFTIAETTGQPSIVNLEDIADGRVSEDQTTVNRVTLRFKSLQTEALPKAATRDLIAKVAEERWNTTALRGASRAIAAATADSA